MKKRISLSNGIKLPYLFCAAVISGFFLNPVPAPAQIQATGMLSARPDNVFVEPASGGVFWDVLRNDDPGTCSPYGDLKVRISAPPTRAMYCAVLSNYIYYIPDGTGFSGRDSLTYEIECDGTVSRAKVYINLNNAPENVYTDVCHVPIPDIGWEIGELTRSDDIVSVYGTPLCGDIDGDGETEILIKEGGGPGDYGPATRIYIFGLDGSDQLYLKDSITTPLMSTPPPILIANVDGDGYASVFMTTDGRGEDSNLRLLIKYKFDPSVPGYEEVWRTSYSDDAAYCGGLPVIAGFSGDGNVQVVVYDKVFDAKTGILLADGGYLGDPAYDFGRTGHTPVQSATPGNTASRVPATSMVPADIDGDGLPEIIGGDCVYKVKITNHTGTSGNGFTFLRRADATGRPDVKNGATAVGDMDLDGQLDVIVTCKMDTSATDNRGALYIYNPRTGAIMNTNVIDDIPVRPERPNHAAGPSVPFVGDVNGDGKPEIALTGRYIMQAYSYDAAGKTLTRMWERTTTDESASTTMSLFDFTQSGSAQLVYRDEDSLRIIDGATGVTLGGFPRSCSPTVDEYPIVADVNGDGAAEIIVSASDASGPQSGSLRIYASAGVPWAPARGVWNQFSYNPVYVNDDLTIPRFPLNPATAFINADTVTRPFNNFLQQATNLNDEGLMLYLGPDLRFDPYRRATFVLDDSGNMTVNIRIGNVGDADFIPPLHISAYVYDTPSDTYTLMYTLVTDDTIKVGKTTDISFVIPNYLSLPFPASYDRWYVFLNSGDEAPAAPSFPYGSDECVYWNNRSSNISFAYGERVICKDKTEAVTLSPSGVYDYRWFDSAAGGTQIATGDTYDVTKDGSLVQRYYIDTYGKNSNNKLNTVRDTVNICLAPDTLIWTGGADADWHNPADWRYAPRPGSPTGTADSLFYNAECPQAKIPRKCTDVLIPDLLAVYPDLRNLPGTATSYEEYKSGECANITFEHGGEVRRTDSLDYDAAYVRLNLDANRWYMLSAPLRSLFTGDYYVTDPNPLKDDVEVYTRMYRSANPETGESDTDAWGWTGTFHNPYIEMTAGLGISFWVDNREDINTITEHPFFFPKHDAYYDVYARSGQVLYRADIERKGLENRFVYEGDGMLPPPDGRVPLAVFSDNPDEQLIVGNPFMSHLDFNRFYAANSTFIKNYYQVLDKTDGVFVTYTVTGAETGTGTGIPALTRYIAPMQSVLAESVSPFPSQTLFAGTDMTTDVAGAKLRGGIREEPAAQTLTIEVSRGDQKNRALLMYSPGYGETDGSIGKTWLKQFTDAVTVYTRDPESGRYLDIQKTDDLENAVIPLGIRTNIKGTFRLNFGGLSSFAPEYDVYLNDSETGTSRNLREGSIHVFDKTSDDLYDNRFTLSFVKQGTGIRPSFPDRNGIEVFCRDGLLEVSSGGAGKLRSVEIYDIQGRLLFSDRHIQTNTWSRLLPGKSFYIIRVQSDSLTRSVKIVN